MGYGNIWHIKFLQFNWKIMCNETVTPSWKKFILDMCKIIIKHNSYIHFHDTSIIHVQRLRSNVICNCLNLLYPSPKLSMPLWLFLFLSLPQDERAPPAVPGHQWTGRGTDWAVQLQDTGVHGGRKIAFFSIYNLSLCMTKKGTHKIKLCHGWTQLLAQYTSL